jgi:hypothetical protein
MDRETRKTILEQAKTHQDLQRQEKKKVEVSFVSSATHVLWPVRKADNLTTILCRCHEIWES